MCIHLPNKTCGKFFENYEVAKIVRCFTSLGNLALFAKYLCKSKHPLQWIRIMFGTLSWRFAHSPTWAVYSHPYLPLSLAHFYLWVLPHLHLKCIILFLHLQTFSFLEICLHLNMRRVISAIRRDYVRPWSHISLPHSYHSKKIL